MTDMEKQTDFIEETAEESAETETLEPAPEETPEEPEKPERTFTQDELTRIVERKVAKERRRKDNAITEREQQLAAREMRVEARELLCDSGLPADLISALNLSNREAMQNSIKTMQKYFGKNVGGYHPKGGQTLKVDPIGEAFKPPKL